MPTYPPAESPLLNLATPVLRIALQLKAGEAAPDGPTRREVEKEIDDLEKDGAQKGYREQQLRDTKLALAALIDQTVALGEAPVQGEWGDRLVAKYFENVGAGPLFFERLNAILPAANDEVDVIEIYYHCLLLGYRGHYHIGNQEREWQTEVANAADRLRVVGRLALVNQDGRSKALPLAAHWNPPDSPGPHLGSRWPKWALMSLGVWLWGVILLFLILNYVLKSDLIQMVNEHLLRG